MLFRPSEQLLKVMVKLSTAMKYIYTGPLPPVSTKCTHSPVQYTDITLLCQSNKNQLDATLCSFYFRRVTLLVSGASAQNQEYLKLVQRPLVYVLSL